jgi:hypothetical protein
VRGKLLTALALCVGVSLAYAVLLRWGIVVLLWADLLLLTVPVVVVPNPQRQERVIVWALGGIVIAILGGRPGLPDLVRALTGIVPALSLSWAFRAWPRSRG